MKDLDQKQKIKHETERQKKKSCAVTEIPDMLPKQRQAGKGDKNRLGDWMVNPEIKERMDKIFGKKKETKKSK